MARLATAGGNGGGGSADDEYPFELGMIEASVMGGKVNPAGYDEGD